MKLNNLNKNLFRPTKIFLSTKTSNNLRLISKNKKILIITSRRGKKRVIKNYPFLKNKNSQFLDKINEYPTVTLVNKIIKNFLQKDYDILLDLVVEVFWILQKYLKLFLN